MDGDASPSGSQAGQSKKANGSASEAKRSKSQGIKPNREQDGKARKKKETPRKKPSEQEAPVCWSFQNSGTCKFGAQCRYSHTISNKSIKSHKPKDQPLCIPFQRTGSCKYGSKCRYSHGSHSAGSEPKRARPSSSKASQDVTNFIGIIQKLIQTKTATVRLNNQEDRTLWFQSWAALSTGAELAAGFALFRMLMRLPASTACIPPTADILRAAVNVGNHLSTETHHGTLLNTLEAIADVIEGRLLCRPTDVSTHTKADRMELVTNIRTSVHSRLMTAIGNPRYAQRASKILCRTLAVLDRYVDDLERVFSAKDEDAEEEEKMPWTGWRNATLGWLQRGKWIKSNPLQQKYNSVEHYADTLCQLVTKLTFFWGAGALFPKCRVQKAGSNPCQQPLYVIVSNQRNLVCCGKLSKGRSCTSKARWRCSRNGHDALCERCFRAVQSKLVGAPGPRASTDIYDAVVERETTRKDGVVYIASHLESRKPPAIGPNWKTTYRLNCSALVGVVRLGASYEPLAAQNRIEWAEVVPVHPQSGFKDDFKERATGRIALRLLTRSDLSTFHGEVDALPTGMRIAIIDLQVFVPEVISVLSVLTDPSLVDHLRHIPFWPRLIGQDCLDNNTHGSDEENEASHEIEMGITITELIDRLPPSRKQDLRRQLDRLAARSTLTGTQLTAFSEALSNGLHCTQGPPGTGKSYLGVTLIRALDLIRTAAINSGYALGPIVVLSYKNHALDEILCDLMHSQEWFGSVIRCGRTEDERLQACMEHHSIEERRAQKVLNERVTCLRSVRRILKDMRTLRSAFEDETGIAFESWMSGRKQEGPEIAAFRVLQALVLFCNIKEVDGQLTNAEVYDMLKHVLHSRDFLTQVDEMALVRKVVDLGKGMEHWNGEEQNRALFLMNMWLQGVNPPPRCAAAAETGCIQISARRGAYCELLHKCLFQISCDRYRLDGSAFCEDHSCASLGCGRPRLADANVCKVHACSYCVKDGSHPVQQRVGDACEKHSCREDLCPKAFLHLSLPFCRRHCCHICHYYATRDPESVKSVRRIEGSLFCVDHKCSVQGCLEYRLQENIPQVYCRNHGCTACPQLRKLVDAAAPRSFLCVDHRCTNVELNGELCYQQRESGSLFCNTHTCRFCRAEGLPLDKSVVDYEPRNVCSLHPLCSNVSPDGSTCTERVCSSSSTFCDQHLRRFNQSGNADGEEGIRMQCQGTTTKGRRCKTEGISFQPVFYCLAHISQMPGSVSDDEEQEGDTRGMDDSFWENAEDKDDEDEHLSQETEEVDDTSTEAEEVANTCKDEASRISHKDSRTGGIPCSQLKSGAGTAVVHNIKDCKTLDVSQNATAVDNALQKDSTHIPFDRAQGLAGGGEEEIQASNSDHVQSTHEEYAHRESESSDDCNAADERLGFGMCHDELDAISSSSESTEGEMPDQMQHLRDILDEDSSAASDSDGSDIEGSVLCTEDNAESMFDEPIDWSWDQSKRERWVRLSKLLGMMSVTIAKNAAIADVHVECARRELSEAAAYSFKRARVIGATVVGAARRLSALRASEPFAMVVEEACEVMEPSLISVLAVRSLCKLELIGDHRQLPAFVQPCWFPIETSDPSIKVSLFERLVRNDPSACSVLDIQRRMRPSICDLTRVEYDDLIAIQDHECTMLQRVGDRLTNAPPSVSRERALWAGKGNDVPGLRSPIFFWDLETQEGRAAVGLSRCNLEEATACVSLCQWLVYCGVPPTCITVITPYKGQKLTIVKKLRALHGKLDKIMNINVSTVDRYQGDENDIVVLSLVSTKPGNRFVALRNRFIVSASRARIGFYIVGSSKAISTNIKGGSGPSHWRRFLKDLENSQLEDEDGDQGSLDEHPTRIGKKLPISCPRHQSVTRDVSDVQEFPSTADTFKAFCTNPCPFKLSWCGHDCQQLCHSSKDTPHTTQCSVLVPRPCDSHADIPLHCRQVKHSDRSGAKSLTDALAEFRCEVKLQYFRPECSHAVELSCFDREQTLSGDLSLPNCQEIVEDYVHPSCGHIRERPECHVRRSWEETPPPCREMVDHLRLCGCKMRMQCHQSIQEHASDPPPLCHAAVVKPRPRCSHPLSSRCFEAVVLRSLWLEQEGEGLGDTSIVVHGTDYGPSETELGVLTPERLDKNFPACLVRTEYKTSCGHTTTIPCQTAFLQAKGAKEESSCAEEIEVHSPLCGHRIKVPCHLKQVLEEFPLPVLFEFDLNDGTDPGRVGHEETLKSLPRPHRKLKKVSRTCSGTFTILRPCGHRAEQIPCKELYSMLNSKVFPQCETIVTLKRPCGHAYDTKCQIQGNPAPKCEAPNDDLFVYPSCKYNHSVRPRTCDELTRLRGLEYPECKTVVTSVRPRCSHVVEVPCHMEQNVTRVLAGRRLDPKGEPLVVEEGVDYCESAPGIKPCNERVSYRRLCGHEETNVPCSRAFDWAASPETAPLCRVEIQLRSPLCQHLVTIECHLREIIDSLHPWDGLPPKHITTDVEDETPITSPVVVQGERIPVWSSELGLLNCGQTTRLRRSCGHEEDYKCGSIFTALESSCEQKVTIACRDCRHNASVPCHRLGDDAPPFMCENLVEKRCTFCDINVVKVECFKEVVVCGRRVSDQLSCGHSISWTCGEEESKTKLETQACLLCMRERFKDALDNARSMVDACCAEKCDADQAAEAAFDSELLKASLISRATSMLPEGSLKSVCEVQRFDSVSLLRAYIDVLQRQLDLVSDAVKNGLQEAAVPDDVLNVSDAENCYDIVCSSSKLREETVEQNFRLVETTYGLGAIGHLFCTKELIARWQKREEDGLLTVYVGAALRCKALSGVEPFRLSAAEIREQGLGRKAQTKMMRNMGKLKLYYESQGFDHVYRCETDDHSERVYWKPGAIIPLMKIEVELHRVCGICLDDTVAGKGWCCARDHFVCRECFLHLVQAAKAADSLKRSVDEEGYVRCPEDKCDSRYEPLLLLQQKHDASEEELKAMFQSLQELRMQRYAAQEMEKALDVQRRQLKAEFDRIQEIEDRTLRRAEQLRLCIVDEILTLRCPKQGCGMAFVDFSGCCALTCMNCKWNFCAWCVDHHSAGDVHHHVLFCNPYGRDYYTRMGPFEEHHARRKKGLIIEMLRNEEREVQERALQCLKADLADLKIVIRVSELS